MKNKKNNNQPTWKKRGRCSLAKNKEEATVCALELVSEYGQPLEAMDSKEKIQMYLNNMKKLSRNFVITHQVPTYLLIFALTAVSQVDRLFL